MRQTWDRLTVLTLLYLLGGTLQSRAEGWRAGVGKVAITPKQSTWMAGYGARTRPSEGAVHDLWAKALVLEDPPGHKAAIVTLDLCGIDRALSVRIREEIKREHSLPLDRIVIACSHTHCGPVVGENLITMYPLDESQRRVIADYTAALERDVKQAVANAAGKLEPVFVSWGTGKADFAVNRRNNKEPDVPALRAKNALEGPVDHDVPVFRINAQSGDNPVRAIVFGYACHCTVLSFYQFCGDYAGFAQIALENRYSGAQAMFVAGCGADQNPLPRRTLELAERYGDSLASSVQRVVDSTMQPVVGRLDAAYTEIPLRFGPLPERAQIESDAESKALPVANRARKLLRTLDTDGKLAPDYPYPVQVWRLGELTWVLLGGEVVVDYSLRLKRNMGSSHTWVSSYCGDVMAYIPSLRVLKEGGYEGATAMIYYGLPTSWSDQVETQIVEAVTRLSHSLGAPGRAQNMKP
jgi:hypothetical protein